MKPLGRHVSPLAERRFVAACRPMQSALIDPTPPVESPVLQ
jgi:hypothetical protein